MSGNMNKFTSVSLGNTSLIKSIIFIFFFMSLTTTAQINRVEPPFWYAGMHNPELEILFYGKNIAQYEVTTSNSITITNIKKTENPNYLFVTINTKDVATIEIIFSFKKNNQVMELVHDDSF